MRKRGVQEREGLREGKEGEKDSGEEERDSGKGGA